MRAQETREASEALHSPSAPRPARLRYGEGRRPASGPVARFFLHATLIAILALLSVHAALLLPRASVAGSVETPPPTASLRLVAEADLAAPQAPVEQPAPVPTVLSSLAATAAAEPVCEAATSPLYCVYTVRAGDTLSGIALAFGLSDGAVDAADRLARSNRPDVLDSDDIFTGQKLRIPADTDGVIHTVLSAETLAEVAAQYGVASESILGPPSASPGAGADLPIGYELVVPSPSRLPPLASAPEGSPAPTEPAPAADAPPGSATPAASATSTLEASATPATPPPTATPTLAPAQSPTATATPPPPTPTPSPSATPATPAPTDAPSATPTDAPSATPTDAPSATPAPTLTPSPPAFIWPASGPVSSYFGPSHPLGIDIDLYGSPDRLIVATAAGVVTFGGGDPCCSYGLYVVIDHGNGFSSLYAHFEAIGVAAGQVVAQGQPLGIGGETGAATGVHLHFELREHGAIVDPLLYLP